MLTVDEDLRGRTLAAHRADHASTHVVVERDLDRVVAPGVEQSLRFDAERATRLGEHHDLIRCLGGRVDVAEHRVRVRDFKRIAIFLGFDEHLLHDAVAHEHRVAPAALAESNVGLVHEHAHAGAELTVAVGQQDDVGGLLVAGPFIHHERVIDRQAHHAVHAKPGERRCKFVVARQVAGRTRRGERAGKREHDNGLALEDVVCGDLLPGVVFTDLERNVGNALAFTILQHG